MSCCHHTACSSSVSGCSLYSQIPHAYSAGGHAGCRHASCGGCGFCHPGCSGLNTANDAGCPYARWRHPICQCNQAYYSCAGTSDGPTLVIHKIVLETGGEQSCTPRTFQLRITGPSYPCGEIFTLRAGSCLTLDEPLVITGLEPGQYTIEEYFGCTGEYDSTITGPVCDGVVTVSAGAAPTVVTIVSRRRVCRRRCLTAY